MSQKQATAVRPNTRVLESGNIAFLYRPKKAIERPRNVDDLERVYFFLFPELLPVKWDAGAIAWALVTGVFGIAGSIILYLLLRAAPASIAVPLSSLYPIVTVVLSYFILRERITPQQWAGIWQVF